MPASHHSHKWLDGVSDALCISPPQLQDLRPLRYCGDTLAPTPTGDYAPSLRSPWRAALAGGCGTTTGSRTGSGALLGAGTGAAIGSLSGNAGKGVLIGAGAGALGGYIYDQNKKKQDQRYYDQNRTQHDQYYYNQDRRQQEQYYW